MDMDMDMILDMIMDHKEEICTALVVGGGLAAAPAALAALAAVGFTSAGIAAGSLAAKLMSALAIANGGGVAAGGLVATLQSIGMAGLSWFTTGTLTGAGGSLGLVLSRLCNQTATDTHDIIPSSN